MADYSYKLSKSKDGEITVEAKADKSRYERAESQAFAKLAPKVKIDGFRPGKAPQSAIVSRLGTKLVEEALNILLPSVAVEIISNEKLNPVTQLEYKVTDIDKDGFVAFTFTFITYPEIRLGDFSKIKVTKESVVLEEKDINEVLVRLFREPFQKSHPEQKEPSDEEILNWITDEEVKEQMGKDYDGLNKLKSDIKNQLERVREQESQEKFEQAIIDKALELTTLEIPAKLVDLEVSRKESTYRNRIKELNIEFEVFVTAQNTTLEKLQEQWRDSAIKELKTDLVLSQIASDYNLVPDEAEVDAEISKVGDQKMRIELNNADGHRYVASMLMRQRGFAKLMELSGANATTDKTK